jgi:DNA-binding SARP family transcriptional activator
MEFRLLGPLEVAERGRSLALGGVKQRSLLAILLLHANELVSSDRLIGELWGDTPPATAAKSIQVYVSRLRKELGPRRVTTRAPGYVLHVDPAELDLAHFERLVSEARRADPRSAADKLRRALALWRGPPLADLAYESFAQTEIARLEELRLTALEARFDADLAAGDHATLVGELEASVAEHPFRERLRCQLMLALYRSARQADALHAYQAARRELAEELGLEPGDELRRLERAILTHDPELDLHAATPGRPVAPPSPPAAPDRSLIIAPATLGGLEPLLALATPLAASEPPGEIIVAAVVDAGDVGDATAALAERREELRAHGFKVRTAAFASPAPGEDLVQLASQFDVALLLMEAGRSPLDGDAATVLERAACDVALLVAAGGSLRPGPVVVPFGAARHDWAALELGAWVAQATGASLRLVGAASSGGEEAHDASRLLADASLMVQGCCGVVAEPLFATPGRHGVVACAECAGLLIVGLSDGWRQEGLGRVRAELAETPPAPMVLIRGGPRPGGLAPTESRTRFSWSLTAAGR